MEILEITNIMGGEITTSRSALCAFNKCELLSKDIDSLRSTLLQHVTGSSTEGEHKAHGHSCIAMSALCTGNHDLICTSFEQA